MRNKKGTRGNEDGRQTERRARRSKIERRERNMRQKEREDEGVLRRIKMTEKKCENERGVEKRKREREM